MWQIRNHSSLNGVVRIIVSDSGKFIGVFNLLKIKLDTFYKHCCIQRDQTVLKKWTEIFR